MKAIMSIIMILFFFLTSCKQKTEIEQEREATIELAKDNDLVGIWRDKEGDIQLTMQVRRVDNGKYNNADLGETYDKLTIFGDNDVKFEKRNDTLAILNKSPLYANYGYNYFFLNGRMYAQIDRKKRDAYSAHNISINPHVWVWEELIKSKQ